MKVTHFRLANDSTEMRGTDRLTNVPIVGQLYQTWQVTASGSGSKVSLCYARRPGVPMDDPEHFDLFVELAKQRTQGDVQGIKAVSEREFAAQS